MPPSRPAPAGALKKTRSIRTLLMMLAILPLVASLLMVGITVSGAAHESIEDEEGNKLAAEAKYFAEMTDQTIGRQLLDLESRAALLPKLQLHQNLSLLTEWLHTIQEKIPEYTWIGFADPQGQVRAATGNLLVGKRVDQREWFQRGKTQSASIDIHEATFLEPLLPKRSDGPWRFIDITSPVRDSQGQLLGVMAAHLSWDWLLMQHARFSESLLRERHAEVIVAGLDGLARLIGPEVKKTDLGGMRSFQLATSGPPGWIRETWPDGRDYLVGYAKNPGYGDGHRLEWITLIRLPVESVDSLIDPALLLIWTLIGGTILFFVLGIQAMLAMTLGPVEQLIAKIETVARQGGQVDISPRTPREFQALGQATNQLILTMEAQQAADQAKTKFLADMSHEIRNPLHGLIGHAELLRARLEDPQDQHDVQHLIQCAQELKELLNQILDLSAIEENRLHLHEEPVCLEELVRFNAEIFQGIAAQKGIALGIRLHDAAGLWVLADRLRLGQVLRNLLSNAVKFTPQGRVDLELTVVRDNTLGAPTLIEGTAQITLSVRDTGIGLTQSQQELIFGRYQRADIATSRKLGGTGLGLSLTRALIYAMKGRLTLESTPGHGTHVEIQLPIAIVAAPISNADSALAATPKSTPAFAAQCPEPSRAAASANKTSPSASAARHILVTDDLDTNREVLVRWLSLHGHRVEEAANAQEAIHKATAQRYDVILMDIDLPDQSGRDAARAIRLPGSASREARLIAVSGYAFEQDIAASKEAGMNAHLAKPIDFEALLKLLG